MLGFGRAARVARIFMDYEPPSPYAARMFWVMCIPKASSINLQPPNPKRQAPNPIVNPRNHHPLSPKPDNEYLSPLSRSSNSRGFILRIKRLRF